MASSPGLEPQVPLPTNETLSSGTHKCRPAPETSPMDPSPKVPRETHRGVAKPQAKDSATQVLPSRAKAKTSHAESHLFQAQRPSQPSPPPDLSSDSEDDLSPAASIIQPEDARGSGDFTCSGDESEDGRSITPDEEPLYQEEISPPPHRRRSYSPGMADRISEAIECGIAAAFKHRSSNHSTPRRSSSSGSKPRDGDLLASSSHELPGTSSHPSVFGKEERPAKRIAGIPSPKAPQGMEVDKADTTDPFFIQPKVEKEVIPSPRIFIDMVQNQWASPGTGPLPNTLDKCLYNVGPELTKALEVPSIDLPIIGLSSSNAASAAPEDALRPEDKRIEQTLVKSHQASAWAIRASTSASFFSGSALLWLRQLQARLRPGILGLAGILTK
ncbi:histone-lysine N-methyltransferase 2D-like [Thamnophis elegans]|uniref:histone-lysine N-methyltransferase 2D-like n=1 Tax=Thamnophis elegans TaxID=35005 RepID=UPI0013765302|nr:histone-lysine N-methyltransferase 2D-like [Thamnophis elegans]